MYELFETLKKLRTCNNRTSSGHLSVQVSLISKLPNLVLSNFKICKFKNTLCLIPSFPETTISAPLHACWVTEMSMAAAKFQVL
jgi:hypothetical protein